MAKLRSIAPYFMVKDVVKSSAYYRDVLGFGFERLWGEPPCFCMPHRDGLIVMLAQVCEPERIRPNGTGGEAETWDAYVWTDDADALFEEFTAKGVRVVYPPKDMDYYGNREFAVRDLDGYVIAFAHDIAEVKKRRQQQAQQTQQQQ